MWPDNFDTDLTSKQDLTVIFKQCWSCFQMFRAKSSAEVRCRKCEKALKDLRQTKTVLLRNGQVVKVAFPDEKAVGLRETNPLRVREMGTDVRRLSQRDAISMASLDAFLEKSGGEWRIRQMGWPWFRAQVRPEYRIGNTVVSFRRLEVIRGGEEAALTESQWRLLAMLCAAGGDVVPRAILASQIGAGQRGRSLDTMVSMTRRDTGLGIRTVHCIGYALEGLS